MQRLRKHFKWYMVKGAVVAEDLVFVFMGFIQVMKRVIRGYYFVFDMSCGVEYVGF